MNVLGVDDKMTQTILRHSQISPKQNIYVKGVPETSQSAMQKVANKCGMQSLGEIG